MGRRSLVKAGQIATRQPVPREKRMPGFWSTDGAAHDEPDDPNS